MQNFNKLFLTVEQQLHQKGYLLIQNLCKELNESQQIQLQAHILKLYHDEWKHKYEIFCNVVIDQPQITSLQSTTFGQIDKGLIQLEEGRTLIFKSSDIKELQITSIFARFIPLEQIKKILKQYSLRKKKKYRNKQLPEIIIIQDSPEQIREEQRSMLPRVSMKNQRQDKPEIVKKPVRKLKLVSSSESQSYYDPEKQSSAAIFSLHSEKKRQSSNKYQHNDSNTNQSLLQIYASKHLPKKTQQFQKQQSRSLSKQKSKEKKQNMSKNVQHHAKPKSKKQLKEQQFQKQSVFMNGWLSKSKSS